MNRENQSKQYLFAQTLDFKFSDELSVNFNFFSLFPLQRIVKGGREISKVCTHWHFAVKLHTQNMHEKLHLDVILTQHSNLFLKEHKKTLSWDSLPGKDSIFLASAWKNANSQSSPCRSSLWDRHVQFCCSEILHLKITVHPKTLPELQHLLPKVQHKQNSND